MSIPDSYLTYANRRYGMDHDRYDWSILPQRKPVVWPNGARVALWVVPALEWFPLDMKGVPFKPPGAMQTAYPDLRHYTLRDYGNRVGIFRVMQALDRHGIRASVAVNAAVAARYPTLLQECTRRNWEIIANGQDMDHLHHAGLAMADEKKIIEDTLDLLREASGQPVRGWLSPAKSESLTKPTAAPSPPQISTTTAISTSSSLTSSHPPKFSVMTATERCHADGLASS